MHPDPPAFPHRGQRALAAIVVTDGVGFSARMSVDEEKTLSLIQRDLQMMHTLCEQYEGQVLKSTGDGLLMYFVSAAQAVTCAIAIQQALAEQSSQAPPDDRLSHRVGIHLGDVFLSESDVMGNGVNIAARLQTEAEPGGICMSQTVYDVVKSRLALNAVYLGPLQLKNIQEAVPAYHLPPASSVQVVTVRETGTPSDARANRTPSSSGQTSGQTSAGENLQNTPQEPEQIEPGHIIHGRYRIQAVLGQGGFGRTYLATDTHRFDDRCVLKEFLPINKSDYVVEKSRDLFEREAKALYQLDHPQIPKFLAWFTHENRLFIVQEYIDGKTYSHLLRDRQQQGRYFSEEDVLHWLNDLLQVLSYLHGLGIVHRDISPDNVMLPTGRTKPVLIDFGLVKQTVTAMWTRNPSDWRHSQNSFVGKLGYAPPEQIRMGQCFPCSDLYALGVTAIVLLTGREPNLLMDQGSLEWQWRSHVQVSDALAQILDRMLAEKPRDRYQSAQEVADSVQRLLTQPSTRSAEQQPAPRPMPQPPPMGTPTLRQAQPIASARPRTVPGLSPQFTEACKQALMTHIGPMASYVVAEAQAKYPQATPRQFLEILAQQIPDAQKVAQFRAAVQAAIATSSPQARPATASPRPAAAPPPPPRRSGSTPASTAPPQASAASAAASSAGTSSISPAFLKQCQTALAQCIGPMAAFILDDVMAQSEPTSRRQLIRAIAAEIPDAQKAREFEQMML